jgi:hypothetical protein
VRALLVVVALLAACGAPQRDEAAPETRPTSALAQPDAPDAPRGWLRPVPFDQVEITDEFWRPRIETHRRVTVGACLDQCDATGRIANFRRCAKLEEGPHQGALYNDSDVYKVIEGVAYTLATARDAELEARVDAVIDAIASAQQPDGYLNTYWTMVKPAERWTNIAHGHELYCAGHLIEAAIAYARATGKGKLLDVAVRFADHIDREFGPDARRDPPGHPELELALVKLWRETGERRYFDLASFFVDQRGRPEGRAQLFGEYAQDHAPVREQREIVGHAVRAMYLYSAMADVAGVTGDAELWEALDALWHDVVDTKMYVTGGIGSSASNEGITLPFDLPNDTAYCETCAAIGMALWNQRMFLATGDAKYADVVERELYNGFLSGVSLSGDRFFYDNPLASRGDHERVPWFDCSCCPTNVVRFLPAIGERIFAVGEDTLYVAQYVSCRTEVEIAGTSVRVEIETDYPWDGDVKLRIDPERPIELDLRLRQPAWCEGFAHDELAVAEGAARDAVSDRGFVSIRREWRAGDAVDLRMELTPTRVHADPRVAADAGRVALMRGPLVYCVEGVDNGGRARNVVVPKEARIDATAHVELPGVTVLRIDGAETVVASGEGGSIERGRPILAVPYYLWANRGANEMVVWLPETRELAERPGENGTRQNGVVVTASHCWRTDTVAALNDGLVPKASDDHSIPRHTFWDHRGTSEWLLYDFEKARAVSSCSVYWFDDRGVGNCRVPKSWRLMWLDGGEWREVKLAPGASYGVARDAPQSVSFEPLETSALKLEVALQSGFSAGVLEWKVE